MDTKKLRQKILDLAIRGKLVPQDPNDEPASVLLERIRAEKERLIAEGKIKRPKKSKTSSAESHYQQLPEGWSSAKLGDLFLICSAKRIMKSDWCSAGIPFYRTREIVKLHECGSVDNDLFISKEYFNRIKHDFGVPKTNDIMLTAVGTIGIPYIVKEDDCFYYKDASVLCLRNFYKLNSKFFFFLILSSELREQMFSASKGTTVDTVTIEKANDYIFMLPPLKEQERIVNVIESYLSIINDLESNLQYLHDCVSITKSKILDLAMRGKLVPQDPADEAAADMLRRINHKAKIIGDNPHSRNIPDTWCRATLRDICSKIVDGDHNPPEGHVTKTNYFMISASNIANNKITHTPVRYLTDEQFRLCNERTQLEKGDILLTTVGTIGRTAIFLSSENITLQRSVSVLTSRINNLFLKYYLDSPSIQKYMTDNAKGTAQKGFYLNQLCSMIISIPPIGEQTRIVAKIGELFAVLDSIEASLQSC